MNHKDPAWLDSMYNNRALVPDYATYFDNWVQSSKAARSSQPCTLDVAYGSAPGEKLDIFAGAAKDAPVLVFIHGGYWRSLDKSDHSFVAPPFTLAGYCVVVVNYALCPGTPEHPVTVSHIGRQMEAALAWVWRHIGPHGGDRRRITVAGHSAGGHLAAWLLTSVWPLVASDLPDGLVRNALSISGLHDLEPVMHAPFLQQSLHLTEQHVQDASPARLQAPAQGLLYSVAGANESEEFARQARLIQDAWGTHVVPRCQILPGLNPFSILDALTKPGHDLHHMALNLLRA